MNDVLGVPAIPGTCTTCHDTPNVGNHSTSLPLDLGLTTAAVRTPDLPLYTFRNKTTGEVVQTTDPGRALITGRWNNMSEFKGPILRGLAARAPTSTRSGRDIGGCRRVLRSPVQHRPQRPGEVGPRGISESAQTRPIRRSVVESVCRRLSVQRRQSYQTMRPARRSLDGSATIAGTARARPKTGAPIQYARAGEWIRRWPAFPEGGWRIASADSLWTRRRDSFSSTATKSTCRRRRSICWR